MYISLTMFPADNGDSFLLSVNCTYTFHVLIDAGYKKTYKNYIRPKLQELSALGLALDLLVVTHIDSDHIAGTIEFLQENGHASTPQIINVKEIWHNSYRHLTALSTQVPPPLSFRNKSCIQQIESLGYRQNIEDDDCDTDISAKQGSSLTKLILEGGYSLNSAFKRKAVSVDNFYNSALTKDLNFLLLSPSNEKLKELECNWKKEMVEKGFIGDELLDHVCFEESFEYLCSYEDEPTDRDTDNNISAADFDIETLLKEPFIEDVRIANGSSISFVIEFNGIRLLFLADSYPTLIEKALLTHFKSTNKPIWFDAIKISHHGSKNNTSPSLLDLIDSDTFLISTNGKMHNHPDPVTIARIVARPTERVRNIYFNYPNDTYTLFSNNKLMDRYKYSVELSNVNAPIFFNSKEE